MNILKPCECCSLSKHYLDLVKAEDLREAAFGGIWVTLLDIDGNREINTPEQRKTIELADGFNGATMSFYADPVEVDGYLVKLQCAEPGKGYMHRWARKVEVEKA